MIAIIELKKDMTNVGIFSIVIDKFSLILLLIDKYSKVYLYYTILSLNLAIYL